MKSDARLLLNKKKWNKGSGNTQPEIWKTRGTVDARKILNLKRRQKAKPPVLGSYMRTKTATALIASQIRKEISAVSKVPDKRIQLSSDGNIIITSKSKNVPQMVGRKAISPGMNVGFSSRSRFLGESMQMEPSSSDTDDLEHTTVDDLIDFESLPPALASRSLPSANLSRKSVVSQVLDKRYTMVADQLAQHSGSHSAKVCVSNLHPTVSKHDVMELFGDVGIIQGVEMIMPGTAIIDFYDEDDAVKACDIYHNRLLDGLPMKCHLQSGAQQQRSTISQRLGERMAPQVNPTQIATSPPVITNSRSRYNPRNVQFTVKLT